MVAKRQKTVSIKEFYNSFSKKLHTPKWLFVLLLIVLLLRIPSFFEPYSYGDEMIYLTLGEAIRRGIPLYSGIHDNKPPLLYLMAAIAGNLFWFKAILAVWHIVTVFLFWKLVVLLFPALSADSNKKRLQKVATIIFALLTTLPLFEGNIANAEIFMIGPIIGAFLLIWSEQKKPNPKKILAGGILISAATLFKIPAAFDLGGVIFLWIIANKGNLKSFRQLVVKTLYLGVGFLLPIAITFIWYGAAGALSEYLTAAFGQNIGYLSSWRPGDLEKPFLSRNGPLLFRGLVVLAGLVILYLKRSKLSKQFVFISGWLLFTLFAVTLSERPYPHYFIQSIAPISILTAILFTDKTKEQVYTIIPLTLAFFVPFYFNFWYYPTTPYYLRFIKFASSKISKEEYFSTFGGNVITNYKVADYIVSATRADEKVFVWGDSPPIYALSRRFPPGKYVADYHIRDFSTYKETIKNLSVDFPKIIVILPNANPVPELFMFLRENYILIESIDGAQIWSSLSPRVRAIMAR
jgi:hypothetical protein